MRKSNGLLFSYCTFYQVCGALVDSIKDNSVGNMASAKGNDASFDFEEDKVGVESHMDIQEVNAKDSFTEMDLK